MKSFILFLIAAVTVTTISAYYGNYHCKYGRDAFVHLFEWKWDDIASECENFLAKAGYCAVQISPPSEHRIITGDKNYPWYQRYQTVSYKLNSRSGDMNAFRSMVERCNNVGVYIYADLVINHMTGGGQGRGSAGTYWNADTLQYPGVPFGPNDFHGNDVCFTSNGEIQNYGNANEVRYCRLVGLRDLRGASGYVQDKLAEYINTMINIGIAGFRIDASKHMFPNHIDRVLGKLNNLNTRWFPSGTRPFVFMEVIDMGGEPIKGNEYTFLGRVTEFKYGKNLGDVVRKNNGQKLKYLKNFGEGWNFMAGLSAVPFIDNHDNQRGHGAGGFGSILTFFEAKQYKIANAFMLSWTYGYPKLMSSYRWPRSIQGGQDKNDWIGPPSSGNGNTNSVRCFNEWVCEHRWRQIANMVRFHNVAVGTNVENWWDNDNQVIAFSRGNKAFIVINNEDFSIVRNFQTGLPRGQYCDVITSEKNEGPCSGRTIDVDDGGFARISVPNDDNPIVAIHV